MNETGKQDLYSTLRYTTTRSLGNRENSIAFLVTSDAPFRDCAQAKLGFEIKSVSQKRQSRLTSIRHSAPARISIFPRKPGFEKHASALSRIASIFLTLLLFLLAGFFHVSASLPGAEVNYDSISNTQ